jgi:hypothetical protein
VVAAIGVAAAINGSWGFLLFLVLTTGMYAWLLALRAAERSGRVTRGRRRVVSQVSILVFAVAAALLGRAIGG